MPRWYQSHTKSTQRKVIYSCNENYICHILKWPKNKICGCQTLFSPTVQQVTSVKITLSDSVLLFLLADTQKTSSPGTTVYWLTVQPFPASLHRSTAAAASDAIFVPQAAELLAARN